MLNGIPRVLTPKLMKTLMEMGHGDEIVLGDGNFPAKSLNRRVLRCDGSDIPELLEAILRFFPLDHAAAQPVVMMEVPDDLPEPPVWGRYRALLFASGADPARILHLPRFQFYERARAAYAVVATGETTRFANILLKKGIVRADTESGKI